MTWRIKDGWEHRAAIGLGPFTDEEFEAAFAALDALPDRIAALKNYYTEDEPEAVEPEE